MADKNLKTGTTTVGVIAKDTVVLAADLRASLGHIAYEEESKKLYKITNRIAITNAGSVGDSLTIIRFLKSHAQLYEMEREGAMSVRAAANLLSNVLNANRFYPYIAQFVLGGVNNEPELFEVTPDGGILERREYAISGSGTEFAMTTLDQNYKKDLNEEDAIRLAVKAIEAGKRRDIFSGGKGVSVMVISRNGVKELSPQKVQEMLDKKPAAEKAQKRGS
ncbi:MAG: proteasome subunit beta [Candidatus Diapherotrites archaeon]